MASSQSAGSKAHVQMSNRYQIEAVGERVCTPSRPHTLGREMEDELHLTSAQAQRIILQNTAFHPISIVPCQVLEMFGHLLSIDLLLLICFCYLNLPSSLVVTLTSYNTLLELSYSLQERQSVTGEMQMLRGLVLCSPPL